MYCASGEENCKYKEGKYLHPQDVLEETIITAIKANAKVSREEIAQKAHVSSKTIARQINKMRDKIKFVGRGYSGHWEVIVG